MSTKTIRGVNVEFPFVPYDVQVNYMDKVIECLEKRQNGVLESPTGTGKTLSLLCSSLAWLEAKKAEVEVERLKCMSGKSTSEKFNSYADPSSVQANLRAPQIFYASRTHSQLLQAMKEMKRTKYNNFKAVVLGSREQMCINEDVLKEESNALKTSLCGVKVKEGSCSYYNRVEKRKDHMLYNTLNIIDIEDIVKFGTKQKFCPFFTAKHLMQFADVIFAPYNYLLDPRLRKSLEINLSNSVIILDEGHNIEKTCEECASIQLKSTDLTSCIEEVTLLMKILSNDTLEDIDDLDMLQGISVGKLQALVDCFTNFENVLNNIPLTSSVPEGTHFDGTYIFEMMAKAGITSTNISEITLSIDKIIQFSTKTNRKKGSRKAVGLQVFFDLLTLAFSHIQHKEKVKDCYKVHVAIDEAGKFRNNRFSQAINNQCRVLSYWCFNPGFGMEMLMNLDIYCLILTSGTLAPLRPLISELELKVDVRIENPHIVEGDQVCVKILTKGPDGELLNCSYQNRENPDYLRSLGQVISNLLQFIPDGVLIFFPSYPIMLKCQKFWQEKGIWESIANIKPIYIEPKNKTAFNAAMLEYYEKINNPLYKGAVFMGVCRGKISEGLDFDDAKGRAVFIVGLPYPPLKDPKVILKQRYLDKRITQNGEYLRGNEWYSLEATRAVNQAIGRVIRHKHDYGAIILLDSRFTNLRIQDNLSLWLKKHIQIVSYSEAVRQLRSFFKTAQEKFPVIIQTEIEQTCSSEKSICSVSANFNNTSTHDAVLLKTRKRSNVIIVDNNVFKQSK